MPERSPKRRYKEPPEAYKINHVNILFYINTYKFV